MDRNGASTTAAMQPRGVELLVVPAKAHDASAFPLVHSSLSLDGVIAYAH